MEYVDIYDEFKNNTCKIKKWYDLLEDSEYTLGVQAIINSKK